MIFNKIDDNIRNLLEKKTDFISNKKDVSYYEIFKYLIDTISIYIEIEHNKHGWYYRIYDIETNEFITQGDNYYSNYDTSLIEGIKEIIQYWL